MTIPAVQAQRALTREDTLAELHSVRVKLARATEENIEVLRSFRFNLTLAAICLNDVDNIQDELEGQLNRLERLSRIRDKLAGSNDAFAVLVGTEAEVAIDGFGSKRRRIQLSMRVCGSVPIVVSRAQLALSVLDEAESTLFRLK
jgi:hypothetical protein